MKKIVGIQPHELDYVWGTFWPMLERAEEFNAGVPIEENKTYLAILNGEVQAWMCIDEEPCLSFTTTIYDTPRGKTLEIIAIGGKGVKEWLWALDKLAEWGAKYECKRLLASGRKGWNRVLSNAGFKTVAYVNERLI